ncbi:MAG: hypothetical protein WA814_06625 [Candidatus Baltobacteraceae bacterium]
MKIDFTPALFAVALAFVVAGSVQFLRDLPGGERGLVLFERACPIHSTVRPVAPLGRGYV